MKSELLEVRTFLLWVLRQFMMFCRQTSCLVLSRLTLICCIVQQCVSSVPGAWTAHLMKLHATPETNTVKSTDMAHQSVQGSAIALLKNNCREKHVFQCWGTLNYFAATIVVKHSTDWYPEYLISPLCWSSVAERILKETSGDHSQTKVIRDNLQLNPVYNENV